MLLFLFAGFIGGIVWAIFRVQRPVRAMLWGAVLGGLILILLLGPGTAPIQGIGSLLNFMVFALGPLVGVPFAVCGAALGIACGGFVKWAGQGRPRWVAYSIGLALVTGGAALTLGPVVRVGLASLDAAQARETRRAELVRANFVGSFAGHTVAFPASPVLYVTDDCSPGAPAPVFGCRTNLTNPVTILTGPNDVLLHERSDPLRFRAISVRAVERDCKGPGSDLGYCLTEDKIRQWCSQIRPDQAESVWCRSVPPMRFAFRTSAQAGDSASPSDRNEPELSARFARTALGAGQVVCFYHPDPAKTDSQGADCQIAFGVADGVVASLSTSRAQIETSDAALARTIELIPVFWSALRTEP